MNTKLIAVEGERTYPSEERSGGTGRRRQRREPEPGRLKKRRFRGNG